MLDFGLTQADFRARFLERQVYVRTAAMSARPLHWSDLDALLHATEPDESSLQLFNNGQVAPPAYVDETFELGRPRRRINKHRFYALLQDGATLVLNRVESHSIPAKRLCAEVARFVGCPTTSNAYVSFGGGGTFGHGGAYATNMTIDPKRGLILVWMVQHAGFPGDGGKSQAAFRKAART